MRPEFFFSVAGYKEITGRTPKMKLTHAFIHNSLFLHYLPYIAHVRQQRGVCTSEDIRKSTALATSSEDVNISEFP